MKSKSIVSAALAGVVSICCVGCSISEPVKSAELQYNVEISEDTGRITLPLDRYTPSEADTDYLLAVFSGVVAECAMKAGVDLREEKPSNAPNEGSIFVEFGPWRKFIAQKFAFLPPASQLQMRLAYGAEGTALTPVTDEEITQRTSRDGNDSAKAAEVRTKCSSANDEFAPENLAQKGPWVEAAY